METLETCTLYSYLMHIFQKAGEGPDTEGAPAIQRPQVRKRVHWTGSKFLLEACKTGRKQCLVGMCACGEKSPTSVWGRDNHSSVV